MNSPEGAPKTWRQKAGAAATAIAALGIGVFIGHWTHT